MLTRHIHHKEGPLYRADVEEGGRERRKFIKLHIMADRKGKVVGFRVTSERTGDTKKFVPLVKEAARRKGNVTKA
ncbi:MAG: transposase [Candidatus Parvarchaeota archaeon]